MDSLGMTLEDFAQAASEILKEEFLAVRHILPEWEVAEVAERMRLKAFDDFRASGPVLEGRVAEEGLLMIRDRVRAMVEKILELERSLKDGAT